jgi:hypothetical protein
MDLGVSQADLLEMVVERAAQKIAAEMDMDRDIRGRVERELEKRLAQAITKIGDEVVAPFIAEGLEKIAIQRTNEWGERTGKSMTLREFLVHRADAYLTEEVNYDGQTVADYTKNGRYVHDFKRHSTRVAYLVDKRFQSAIESAMADAVKSANEVIADGIAGAVKIRLTELSKSFAVKVEKPR